jgi:ketosteroid isomerase-like protein
MKKLIYSLISSISLGIAMIGCNPGNMHEAEKANIHKAYEALSAKDFATFANLCSDDFTELSLGPQPIKGVQNAINQYKMFFSAFPDFKAEVTEVAAAGKNQYFLKVHLTGTNTGSFMNLPPTSKHIDLWNMDIVELNDAGKAISHWVANPNNVMSAIGYGSYANPNTAVVMAAYEAFGKKDLPGVLNLCSDDVVFEVHDISLDSKANIYKGKDGVTKFFQDLGSKVTYTIFQPSRFLADGDDVTTLVHAEFKQNSSGKNFAANYDHYFKVVNGKIVSFKGVSDFPKAL